MFENNEKVQHTTWKNVFVERRINISNVPFSTHAEYHLLQNKQTVKT